MERISGSVEHITFSNQENGFAVVELSADGELLTAVGTMPGVAEGEEVELEGEFVTHPSFGPQFQVSGFSCRMPQDAAAVLRYLASGALPGIGPVLARRIVDEFGADTLSILENEPRLLTRVRGMTEAEAHRFIVHSAMDRCVKKRQVAREIIEYHEKYEEKRGNTRNAEGNSHRP